MEKSRFCRLTLPSRNINGKNLLRFLKACLLVFVHLFIAKEMYSEIRND